ncbi:hypothetical protein [Gloeocapsa sp. PCC 73106]|uniref:hypothetical protein n=1 Tax=Gloeocapsa sp. PCC 73106 TaxID=102232 RepID=UPI0002ABA03C|nr:hypothetical protein [Gloeocapsa sp. PCC 73106]ELR96430.1 hypothetical protein GLO73106DRAFT_00002240 [Gloeocapsa sp. PCC 73106]
MSSENDDLQQLFRKFETITSEFQRSCSSTVILVKPENDPHQLYDYYLDALLIVYFNKYAVLCQSLIQSLESENYLMYGLIGRAIIEHTAILRYYVTSKMLPLVEMALADGQVTETEVAEIIPWLEKHLTGQRFNWAEFLADYFDKVDDAAADASGDSSQVNILTCLEKWVKNDSQIGGMYALFSDLVHPNLGSTLLISRLVDNQVGIGGDSGEAVGLEIVKRTFSQLVDIFAEVQEQLRKIRSFKFCQALRVK